MNARLHDLLAEHAADPDPASPRASRRRAEVMALHAATPLADPADQTAAAAVLLPGALLPEVQTAQSLALAAMANNPAARPLAAAAYDRLRLLAGKPQKFGTQATVRDGRRVPWPVDATTTDSERAKWGLPALAELERRVVEGVPGWGS